MSYNNLLENQSEMIFNDTFCSKKGFKNVYVHIQIKMIWLINQIALFLNNLDKIRVD